MNIVAMVFSTALSLLLCLSTAYADDGTNKTEAAPTPENTTATKVLATEIIEDAPIKMAMDQPQGELIVTSNISGTLWIDHEKVGLVSQKEMRVKLPIGKHSIRISADGYNPFVRKVKIRGGKPAKIKGKLKQGGGTVEFQASAKGAYVILDNMEPAVLPIRLNDLSKGKHTYVIKAKGHLDEVGEFVFGKTPKENIYIYKSMESSKGMVQISTNPEGAKVYLNDVTSEAIGETPLQQDDILPAKHVVIIKKKNYGTVFREMDTSSGDLGVVKAAINKRAASLSFISNVSESVFSLNKAKIGSGNKVKFGKLEKGIYNLSVTAPEHKPIYTQITIPNTGSITFKANMASESDEKQLSTLTEQQSIFGRWMFWSAVGGASLAAGGAAYLTYQLMQPTPAEEGDVTIQLP